MDPGLDGRPDLQIQSTVDMGDGSLDVCDTGSPPFGGGVPGVDPPSFEPNDPFLTGAFVDFACRFEVFSRADPCTIVHPTGQSGFVSSTGLVQYCDIVAATAEFPPGEALLTVRVRDIDGETGPAEQIVLRVATPTPTVAP